ncbi:DUF2252 domain-containing protein [Pengzhenrongella frigida]|uniref:DUF2252 domain-containing protein n=1 Tax=Pengzhenrongella frigida TaxID=1259133 RepID=UPI001F5D4E95|nr:DUF2252 domain-containing protein [Cellulomonas sp. HLT2-17]
MRGSVIGSSSGAVASREERATAGRAVRDRVPLAAQAALVTAGRSDPVAQLEGQAASRVPELVPIRYGRMLDSPFTFYRGGALIMASDLSQSPHSGLIVQLCGDAHLSNFGVYASPERKLVFDVNDFDETHPGPFEWDVKRLAASLEVAARGNGFSAKKCRKVVLQAVAGYRDTVTSFSHRGNLEVWYSHLDMEELLPQIGQQLDAKRETRMRSMLAKARTRDSVQALAKLTTMVDGRPRIVSQPPLVVPVEELWGEDEAKVTYERLTKLLGSYRRTLQSDRRHLLEQFTLVQIARKVVGVGSVGTRAWILLFEGLDGTDPLFLQAKEAQKSVLSGFTKANGFKNQGERVVAGQHLMQATSDIFLGWDRVLGPDGVERDFYLRQLRDGKASAIVESQAPDTMGLYGRLCGQALARAHARSGDRVAITGYLGEGDEFDQAIADFATSYADLNELDHALLVEAVRSGRVTAQSGI